MPRRLEPEENEEREQQERRIQALRREQAALLVIEAETAARANEARRVKEELQRTLARVESQVNAAKRRNEHQK